MPDCKERIDAKDVTFVIPVRIDSKSRMENLVLCTKLLHHHFDTNITILEADTREKVFPDERMKIDKIFIEDFDAVFHRTQYINIMIEKAHTPYIGVWDADALISPLQLEGALQKLRADEADFVLPYDGRFFHVPPETKEALKMSFEIDLLPENTDGMSLMNGNRSEGGAFLVDKRSYEQAGLENERFYGWGPEDKERIKRMEILGYKIAKTKGPLFHLPHKRGRNSWYGSPKIEIENRMEVVKICSMSTAQLKDYVKNSIIAARGKTAIDPEEPREYDRSVYLVFDDRKLAYLVTSKVACTSIKTVIGKAYAISSDSTMGIHAAHLWNRKVDFLDTPQEEYFKFSFVRNPFDRLVSCYRDRVEVDLRKFDFDSDPYFESEYGLNYRYKIRAGMPFEEFIKTVITIPHHLADRHFKSLYATLYCDQKCKVDFVGKYETLQEDWAHLAQRFDFDPQLPELNRSAARHAKKYWEYYTPELVELVYAYYRDDIDHFGYEEAYRQLRSKVRMM